MGREEEILYAKYNRRSSNDFPFHFPLAQYYFHSIFLANGLDHSSPSIPSPSLALSPLSFLDILKKNVLFSGENHSAQPVVVAFEVQSVCQHRLTTKRS